LESVAKETLIGEMTTMSPVSRKLIRIVYYSLQDLSSIILRHY